MAKTDKTVRLGAITASLDWAYRQTCSHENFDAELARAYIRVHVDRSLRLMRLAAERGAKLILGPEYFRGSELFTTTLENRRTITEPVETGLTTRQMQDLSRECGVYLSAAFDAQHEQGIFAQTAVLTGPDGQLLGFHRKHGTCAPTKLPETLELFDVGFACAGMLVCADVSKPRLPLDMAERGMNLLLISGCGFMGDMWQGACRMRAHEHKCVVVHSDGGHAIIVSPKGDVLAMTDKPNDVIVADVDFSLP